MLRNVMTVLSGTLLAQVIGLLCLPILSRLYDPADFGRYQLYFSSMNILLMTAAFRYEVGLLTAEKGEDLSALFALTLRLCLMTSALSFAVLALAGPWIADAVPGSQDILWVLPLVLLIAGVSQALTFLPIRYRNYRLAARTKVAQASGFIGISMALAMTSLSGFGMIIGDLGGRLLAAIQILRKSPRDEIGIWRSLDYKEARQALSRHRSFPINVFPGTLLSAISAALIPIAFARMFSLETAGQYTLVDRSLFIPIGMIAFATSQVFTGDLAHEFRSDPVLIHQKFRKLLSILAIGALPIAVFGWLFLPEVVPVVFGQDWVMAGELAGIAAPFAGVILLAAPVNMVLLVVGYRRTQLTWEVTRFVAVTVTFWLLITYPDVSPQQAMSAFSGVGCAAYLIFLGLADRALAQTSQLAQVDEYRP